MGFDLEGDITAQFAAMATGVPQLHPGGAAPPQHLSTISINGQTYRAVQQTEAATPQAPQAMHATGAIAPPQVPPILQRQLPGGPGRPRKALLESLRKALGALLDDKTRRCWTTCFVPAFCKVSRPPGGLGQLSGRPLAPPEASGSPEALARNRAASSTGAFSSLFWRSGLAAGHPK